MQVNRLEEKLEIILMDLEAAMLDGIFAQILRNYAAPPDELDSEVSAVWYYPPVRRDDKNEREWIEDSRRDLHEYRSAHAEQIGKWRQEFAQNQEKFIRWMISLEEADELVAILNDHRLYRAAEAGIGQAEMDLSFEQLGNIQQGSALVEIHILASLIELLLCAMGQQRLDEESEE